MKRTAYHKFLPKHTITLRLDVSDEEIVRTLKRCYWEHGHYITLMFAQKLIAYYKWEELS